jgi:SAM-dependent methyltransferase
MEDSKQICIVCGLSDARTFCRKNNLEYVSCVKCGHVYVKDPVNAQAILNHYSHRQSHHASETKEQWDYSPTKEKLVYRPQLKRLNQLTSVGKLLDIGCSNGSFLKAAQNQGWDAYGIELEKSSFEVAQKHGLKVYNTELSQQHFPDNHFSAVTLWQVIEHLTDPATLIKEIIRILQPGGVLAISTPNIRSIGWTLLHEQWGVVEPEVHLNLFDQRNLDRLISSCGLIPRHSQTEDIKPSTVKSFLRGRRAQTDKRTDSVAALAGATSARKMEALLIFRHLINFPLTFLGIGEDIYAYYTKPH